MAEERNTGLTAGTAAGQTGIARAPQTDDTPDSDEATKVELQRRMEEARESISQTVSEIKDTVTTQYETVRHTINENLDWREHVRKRPTAFSIGAGTVGFFLGLAVGGAFGGRSDDDRYDYSEYEYEYDADDDTYSPTPTARSLRSQMMADRTNAYDSTSDAGKTSSRTKSYRAGSSPSYAAGMTPSSYDATEETEQTSKPGMLERFRGTQAYDKLTSEISTLGNRAVDELSHTAQTVVLPMVLGKLKDAIGIDLSTQKKVSERSNIERQTSEAQADAISSTKNANQRSSEQDKQNNATM